MTRTKATPGAGNELAQYAVRNLEDPIGVDNSKISMSKLYWYEYIRVKHMCIPDPSYLVSWGPWIIGHKQHEDYHQQPFVGILASLPHRGQKCDTACHVDGLPNTLVARIEILEFLRVNRRKGCKRKACLPSPCPITPSGQPSLPDPRQHKSPSSH